ncbi:MAG: hypothetical protein WCD20_20915 [Rhodomicrobium sp.]
MRAVEVSAPLPAPVRLAAGLLCWLAVFLSAAAAASAQSSAPRLNSIDQIGSRLAQCWHAPQTDAFQIVEVTVRIRFSREGTVMGEPRTTYIHAGSMPGLRAEINASILEAIKACTPLPFTHSLGAAIAGRMLAIRFRSVPLSGPQREI